MTRRLEHVPVSGPSVGALGYARRRAGTGAGVAAGLAVPGGRRARRAPPRSGRPDVPPRRRGALARHPYAAGPGHPRRRAAAPRRRRARRRRGGPAPTGRWRRCPALLGADDDVTGFDTDRHPLLAEAWRRHGALADRPHRPGDGVAGARRCSSRRSPARRRSRASGCSCTGTASARPGPDASCRLWIQPGAETIRRVPSWEWLRMHVDPARSRALVTAARVADSLERTVGLTGDEVERRLTSLPGIGVWTAAEVRQRAHGDADAVSFGDYHVAKDLGWAVAGRDVRRRRDGRVPRAVATAPRPGARRCSHWPPAAAPATAPGWRPARTSRHASPARDTSGAMDLTPLRTAEPDEVAAFFAEADPEELVDAVAETSDADLLDLIGRDEIRPVAIEGILARLHEYAVPERLAGIRGTVRLDLVRRGTVLERRALRFTAGAIELVAGRRGRRAGPRRAPHQHPAVRPAGQRRAERRPGVPLRQARHRGRRRPRARRRRHVPGARHRRRRRRPDRARPRRRRHRAQGRLPRPPRASDVVGVPADRARRDLPPAARVRRPRPRRPASSWPSASGCWATPRARSSGTSYASPAAPRR